MAIRTASSKTMFIMNGLLEYGNALHTAGEDRIQDYHLLQSRHSC